MSVLLKISKFSARYSTIKLIRVHSFATTGRKISKSIKGVRSTLPRTITPPPASVSIEDAWVEVVDKPSGSKYFWNTVTNETTELGAPKPTTGSNAGITTEANKGGGSMMGGLGRVVAEGFAFGVGMLNNIKYSMY